MDILTHHERRRRMQAVRRKNTTPEAVVRTILRRLGIRYSSQCKRLPGTPDFVLKDLTAVLFVHGCFWHRHACRAGRSVPRTNARFWRTKFRANQLRDRRASRALRLAGYRVVVVWECHTRRSQMPVLERRIARLLLPGQNVRPDVAKRCRPSNAESDFHRTAAAHRVGGSR